jgi:hypothetical protein
VAGDHGGLTPGVQVGIGLLFPALFEHEGHELVGGDFDGGGAVVDDGLELVVGEPVGDDGAGGRAEEAGDVAEGLGGVAGAGGGEAAIAFFGGEGGGPVVDTAELERADWLESFGFEVGVWGVGVAV